jgi:hypothetical protein
MLVEVPILEQVILEGTAQQRGIMAAVMVHPHRVVAEALLLQA